MDNINKWNEKYKHRDNSLKDPEVFIVDNVNNFKQGSLLDLASGDGRNSIFLAKKGFNVTSVDFSSEALKRLSSFAEKEDVSVKTLEINLSSRENLMSLGKFDNILINHYKVEDSLLPILEDMLTLGGKLIYCTFNIKHHLENGFKREFCLEEKELINKLSLTLVKYESFKSKNGYIDGHIFTK